MTANSSAVTPRPSLRRTALSAGVLCIIAAALSVPYFVEGWLENSSAKHVVRDFGLDLKQTLDRIKADIQKINDSTAQEETRLWEAFGARMTQVGEINRRACQAGVDNAVRQSVLASEIGWLIADFAQDKVRGGNRAAARVQQNAAGLIGAMQQATARTGDLVAALEQELNALHNQHAARLGGVISSYKASLPKGDFSRLEAACGNVPLKTSVSVGGVSAAAALEAVYVQSTRQAVKSVVEYLAKRLAPQAGRAATGVGAVAVDGPLPIGDIVAVGLGIWTVWEVVKLPNAIRGTVREEFQRAAEAHLSALDGELRNVLDTLTKQTRESREKLHADLLAKISR
jgi:hypothetical protein